MIVKRRKVLQRNIWDVLIVLILGEIYIITLLPGIGYSGDTAKFQFVGKVLGIPHAPGFPTYVLINHFFTKFFPFGSLAYKANLLSAIFSILSCVFLFHILVKLNIKKSISFLTSLTFGLTYTMWSQSIIAEVYSLNIMFVATIIYLLIQWEKTSEVKNLLIAFLLFAISLGNHLSIITFFPAIILFVWMVNKDTLFNIKNIIFFTVFLILGISQYLYIFWRINNPNLVYSEAHISNLKDFFGFITGSYFKSVLFIFPIKTIILERIPFFLKSFLKEYHFTIPIGIYGVINIKNRPLRLFLLLSVITNIFLIMNYNTIPEVRVYFIPMYFIFAIFLGIGIDRLSTIWKNKRTNIKNIKLLLLIGIPLIYFFVNYDMVNQYDNTIEAKRIKNILQTVERNAIIISPSYDCSEYFWYYLIGNGLQKLNNIYLIHHYSPDSIKEYICDNVPIYLPEQRMYVPLNLNIFCIDSQIEDDLNKIGLKLTEIKNNLYIVKP